MTNDTTKLEHDIADTRAALEETVEALSYKTDIGARAKDALDENVNHVKETVEHHIHDARDLVYGSLDNVHDTVADKTKKARKGFDGLRDKPIAVLLGSIVVGAIIGSLFPLTRIEKEKIGGIDGQVRDYTKNLTTDLIAQGKEYLLAAFRPL
jgi:hypothetical protein